MNKQGKLVIEKGFIAYNPFQKAYEEAVADKVADDSPMLVHCRARSAGAINKANTHPFPIKPQNGPEGCFIHNGTLFQPAGDWQGPPDDRKCDSRVVANALNNILSAENVLNSIKELGVATGGWNKLVFLYEDKRWAIINEGAGFWVGDIWYSNTSCGVVRGK